MASIIGDVAFLLDRAADPAEFERWLQRARATGWCEHPIRLTGTTRRVDPASGEVIGMFSADNEPDGALLKACGTRRATMCGPCSRVYRSDAWQLIAAGLRGGKGVPVDVAEQPMAFVTLTAPSFGPVHSDRVDAGTPRLCRPRRPAQCVHGQPTSCVATHSELDEQVGEPLCPRCFDYVGAILWNAHATELWRRTLIGTQRRLASHLGVTASALRNTLRVSFAKVVEYQRRGLVHLHVVIRLDGPTGPSDPAPPGVDGGTLESAVVEAARHARCPYPITRGGTDGSQWGQQVDVRLIVLGSVQPEVVAAYISKYATKSTDSLGRLDRRLQEADLNRLTVRPHLAELVRTAWMLGGRPELESLGLRRWAHTLGFRGHWLTKSRHYSTTLGALRSARATWRAAAELDAEPDDVAIVKDWQFAGRGWTNPGDAWLAKTAAAAASESRHLAREAERRNDPGS